MSNLGHSTWPQGWVTRRWGGEEGILLTMYCAGRRQNCLPWTPESCFRHYKGVGAGGRGLGGRKSSVSFRGMLSLPQGGWGWGRGRELSSVSFRAMHLLPQGGWGLGSGDICLWCIVLVPGRIVFCELQGHAFDTKRGLGVRGGGIWGKLILLYDTINQTYILGMVFKKYMDSFFIFTNFCF